MLLRARVAAVLCALTFTAACSDSGGDGATESVAPLDTTSVDDTATETTVTDSLGADDIDGDWVVVRYATEDNGFSGLPEGSDPSVTFRSYALECRDEPCSAIDAYIGRSNGVVNSDEPLEMAFDGSTLTAVDEWNAACRSVTSGAYDGPEESQGVANISLVPQYADGMLVSFVGEYDVSIQTEASAECTAETVSLKSDMVLFRPELATALELADGVFWGEGALGFGGRGISGCAEGSCVLREPYTKVGAAGPQSVWVQGSLTPSDDGSYTGAVTFTDNCVDADFAWVADDAIAVTVEAIVAHVEVAGFGMPILLVFQQVTGEAAPDLAPELTDQCGEGFVRYLTFAGVSSEQATLIDFDAPALGTDV